MLAQNKKAYLNYNLLEKMEAGVVLTGEEVKTLKERGGDLNGAYVKIINNEAFLVNANIFTSENSTRTRKLLLHKKEIFSLLSKIKSKKLTLIPLKLYNKGRRIKLEFALAKPKKGFEKKEVIKRQEEKRQAEIELKDIFRKQ